MGKNKITKQPEHRKQELKTKPAPTSISDTRIEFRYNMVDEVALKEKVCCPWILLDDFIKKSVHDFASMKWSEIKQNEKNNHFVDTKGISKYYKDRLKILVGDGLNDSIYPEDLFSLRLSGIKRIYGLPAGKFFYVIWFDPEHEVYPSVKKHT
jgi:hypothetical protein